MSDSKRRDWEPYEERQRVTEIAEPVGHYDLTPTPFPEQVAWLVGYHLSELESSYAERGRSLADVASPQELAARMVAVVPRPSQWDDLLGPFYGGAQIAEVLGGISRQAVAERRERRTLLGLKTADGHWVYPVFQLDERNTVLPGLSDLLRALAESGVDDWSLAGWLVSPLRSLAGRTPIEWLLQSGDLAALLAAGREAARRFAQ
jgi:hypothetical protein